jgi:hypothetical protein
VLEISRVEDGQFELDVPKVTGAVGKAFPEQINIVYDSVKH